MTKRTRGTGCLILRGKTATSDGIWWMQYCQDGKVYRESTGSPLKTKAEIKLRKRLTEIEHGKFRGLAAEKMTVEKMVERLLAKKANGEIKHAKSLEWDKTRWNKHLK